MVARGALPSIAYTLRDMSGFDPRTVIYTVTEPEPVGPEGEIAGVLFGAWSADGDLVALVFGEWSATAVQFAPVLEDWSG